MYKWFLNRGPNCATQNHNTQGRPNGYLRSHPTQSPRARDTHPLDQRSQLTVEPPDGLGGGVIINAKVFRDRVHGNATSAHLSRVRSDPLVHRHRGRPDEVHLDGQPGQGANVFLPGPARDCGRDGRVGAARGVRVVTWAISRKPLRPGAQVTAGDVCHLHPDRAAAERCGALMGGAPDLVRLEKHTARVYRVLWSLSDVAGGELRKPAPLPAPPPAKQPGGAVRSWPGNVRISGPVAARARAHRGCATRRWMTPALGRSLPEGSPGGPVSETAGARPGRIRRTAAPAGADTSGSVRRP